MLNKIYVKSFKTVNARYTISALKQLPLFFGQLENRAGEALLSFSQTDKTEVLCVGAAVLFSTEILFTPYTQPRCCHFVRKKKSSDTASETDPQTGKV